MGDELCHHYNVKLGATSFIMSDTMIQHPYFEVEIMFPILRAFIKPGKNEYYFTYLIFIIQLNFIINQAEYREISSRHRNTPRELGGSS